MVFFRPSSILTDGTNPISLFALSMLRQRRGCPLGFWTFHLILISAFINFIINSTNSFIVISLPLPMLIGSLLSYFSAANMAAFAASSTYKKSLDGLPSPQSSISEYLKVFASCVFFINDGITFEVLGLKLSPGPYRFVGTKTIDLKLYC